MIIGEQQKIGLMVTAFTGLVGLLVIGYFHMIVFRDIIKSYDRKSQNMKTELTQKKKTLDEINATLKQNGEK